MLIQEDASTCLGHVLIRHRRIQSNEWLPILLQGVKLRDEGMPKSDPRYVMLVADHPPEDITLIGRIRIKIPLPDPIRRIKPGMPAATWQEPLSCPGVFLNTVRNDPRHLMRVRN